MSQAKQPQDEFIIEDPETLKVLADSLRLDILRALKQPHTVKQVGYQLELPPTKLYYHVNLLERHGLIRVVDTNIVSGIIEKRYQIAARRYKVQESLLATTEGIEENLDHILGAIFHATQSEIKRSVQSGLMTLKPDAPCEQGLLLKTAVAMTEEQVVTFCTRLQALLEEIEGLEEQTGGDDKATITHGLSVAFYPIPTAEAEKNERSSE